MADRLWIGNPGCQPEPCCEEDDPIVNNPCCLYPFSCGETNIDSQHLTLTNQYGTCDLYPFYTRGGFGGTGPITGYQWFGVMQVPCDRTTSTWCEIGELEPGVPWFAQHCGNIQPGNTHISYIVTCNPSFPGRISVTQGHALMTCPPNSQYPGPCENPGGDNFYYALRETYFWLRSDHTHNQTYPVIGFLDPYGQESGYQPLSTTGGYVSGSYVSQDESSVTFNFPANNLATAAVHAPAIVVGGTHTVTKPTYKISTPDVLYLTDNFGEVPLIYNGPRPVSLGTASDMWWGCATRSVTNGRARAQSGDCDPTPINFDTEIVFGLWCKGPSEGFRLYIFHDGCGSYDDGFNVQTHQRKSLGCTTAWLGQYNQIVGGSINGIQATDCSPFVWGPVSQNFPSTPYPYHPLREIYGESGTWTITE